MDSFVHLETHSAFSFLWGAFTPEELVKTVASQGQKAVALTDFGLHGAVRFYKSALAQGIQPIIGAKIPMWDGSRIIMLATRFEAYANLCRLVSLAHSRDVTKQDICHFSRNLVCIAGLRNSRIREALTKVRLEEAQFNLRELRSVLANPEWLFLALQSNGEDPQVVQQSVELSLSVDIPLVATNEVTFLRPEDYAVHQILVDIQRKHHHRRVNPLPNETFFLAPGRVMEEKIPHRPAIENTRYIASLCKSFSFPIGKSHPPFFQAPDEASAGLTKLCWRETARLYKPVPFSYMRRLNQELDAIRRKELSDFFLLVKRVVDFAKTAGIRHTVRGSAAGSLVVYLLLGGVDPVSNNLLFERFINDGRGDLPDIDIDFDSERRDEVIDYVMECFPRQTAMVSTIQTFKCRSAVRLAARAMGYSLEQIDALAKCLPWSLRGSHLKLALETLPELRDAPIQHETELVDLAARLIGLPCQSSVHLGGVIITPQEITAWTPTQRSPKGLLVGQLDKDDVDALGLLKLDILGLRMHTAIGKALGVLEEQNIELNLERIPLDDKKTYSLLCSTHSVGVFQLESPGQRNLLGRLQPQVFSDLVAETSLFRPGPVEGNIVETYLKRRNGDEPITYPHQDLKPILAETYGVILFQEQVLRIAHVFAGLSYGEADAFRRAMTKERKSKKMEMLKQRFLEGARARGHDRSLIEKVFRQVAAFASFGFCKAHAASFSNIIYQSAYLKAHYPQAFYVGLLNAGQVGSYPPFVILNEASRRNIAVYQPHVNFSSLEYKAEGAGIRVPLTVVHGLGPAMARRIVAHRERYGPFQGREDFLERVPVSHRIAKALFLAGAFDGMDPEWCLVREVCNA
jgi:DNA-directed DNA polymerase III PolC